MIVVKLQGGLGNQMFQYALGRAVSNRLGTELVLETSYYDESPNRQFELDKFNIKAAVKKTSLTGKIFGRLG
ncbi:MAG: alpha-1,2-fucosyltransferase, partial [Candidatus Liptonbacteria bacterium]